MMGKDFEGQEKEFKWRAKVQKAYKNFGKEILSLSLNNVSSIQEQSEVLITDNDGNEYAGIVVNISEVNEEQLFNVEPLNFEHRKHFYSSFK